MAIRVEANLRIPRVTVSSPDQPPQVIDNSGRRFTKLIDVPTIPKPGESLELSIGGGIVFTCTVTRADWSDDRDLFVVSCAYAKRSLSAEEYHALVSDSDWTMKQLP